MLKAYLRYSYKLKHLGLGRSIKTVQHNLGKKLNSLIGLVREPITWPALKKLGFIESDFKDRLPFIQATINQINSERLIFVADRITKNRFDLLGSGMQKFAVLPWHRDFRCQKQYPEIDSTFDREQYFRDSVIQVHQQEGIGKDIKVPWELARFQFAPVLGVTYAKTKQNKYAHAAKQQITSFLDANRFCYGIHWFNGMEVAIRAINWIVALVWLQEPFMEDLPFYHRMVCSLYDHMRYLECNWEWYDGRTNNHYFANLVGYAYLCQFFKSLPESERKGRWYYQQLLSEFDWQIFDEGTSYEGSTRYHAFVTELCAHGFLVAQSMGYAIDKKRRAKFERMMLFSERCKPNEHQDLVAIGDDDSGSLLDKNMVPVSFFAKQLGLSQKALVPTSYTDHYYQNFGLSIAKRSDWHVSLRHHAYQKRQPSGHFHQDIGSITVAYEGTPIIVDPGSYVYTASAYWRNYFRSIKAHNTVYGAIDECGADLFSLSIAPSINSKDAAMEAHILLKSGMVRRTISIRKKEFHITDHGSFNSHQNIFWNFVFAPEVAVTKSGTNWRISIGNQRFIFVTNLQHGAQYEAFVAPSYGVKIKTYGIYFTKRFGTNFEGPITFMLIAQ